MEITAVLRIVHNTTMHSVGRT